MYIYVHILYRASHKMYGRMLDKINLYRIFLTDTTEEL